MADSDPGLAVPPEAAVPSGDTSPPPADEGGNSFTALRDDVGALVDDARTYVEAELAYQKTRVTLAGKYGGVDAAAAAGIGLGADVLVGGTGEAFSLQPLAVEGEPGIGIAAGAEQVELIAAN